AAADIGKAEIVERPQRTRIAAKMREQSPTDEIDARGVYLMERSKAASWVPPVSTLRREAIDVLSVYGIDESAHYKPGVAVVWRLTQSGRWHEPTRRREARSQRFA